MSKSEPRTPPPADETLTHGLRVVPDLDADALFDYAGFAASTMQYEDVDASTPPVIPSTAESRETVDLGGRVADGCAYSITQVGPYDVVAIRGRINETFPGEEIGECLKGQVIFDLSQAARITSFGVRSWLEMMKIARFDSAVFYRASPAVVSQVSMMSVFCGGARIHSLIAPYRCTSCEEDFGAVLYAQADRAIFSARRAPMVVCGACGGPAELDEDPWGFLNIESLLLTDIDPELERVVEAIGGKGTHAPIEQALVGEEIHLRFNTEPSAAALRVLLAGIEGAVQLDLTPLEDGAPGLGAWLAKLARVAGTVRVVGLPIGLVQDLLEVDPRRLRVLSVRVMAGFPNGDMCLTSVDLVERRARVLEGYEPRRAGVVNGGVLVEPELEPLASAVERWTGVSTAAVVAASAVSPEADRPVRGPAMGVVGIGVGILLALGGVGLIALALPGARPPSVAPLAQVVRAHPVEPVVFPTRSEIVAPVQAVSGEVLREPASDPAAPSLPVTIPVASPIAEDAPEPVGVPELFERVPSPIEPEPEPEPDPEPQRAEAVANGVPSAPPAPEVFSVAGRWTGTLGGRPLTLVLRDGEGTLTGTMTTTVGPKQVTESVSGSWTGVEGSRSIDLTSQSGLYHLSGSLSGVSAGGAIEIRGRRRGEWSVQR